MERSVISAFAIKYAGKRVKVIDPDALPRSGMNVGIIVGFDRSSIIIEFEDKKTFNMCWELENRVNHGITLVVDRNNSTRVWAVDLKYIELINDKPVVIYPHICKICKSPARITSNFIICSNVKCKSRLSLKVLTKSVKKIGQHIKCPTCKKYACELYSDVVLHMFKAVCKNKHRWTHLVKDNDVFIRPSNIGGPLIYNYESRRWAEF